MKDVSVCRCASSHTEMKIPSLEFSMSRRMLGIGLCVFGAVHRGRLRFGYWWSSVHAFGAPVGPNVSCRGRGSGELHPDYTNKDADCVVKKQNV